jgi:hypothetical protein
MPSSRTARRTAAALTAAVCLLPVATYASPDGGRSGAPDPVSERQGFSPRQSPLTSSSYTGIDGQTHQRSPILVRGKNGIVFYGEEFDGACGYGRMFDNGLARLARLAKVIDRSGRRVVFTVPPNKSAVMKRHILKSQLPHGRCDLKGIAQQDRALDRLADRRYVPVRSTLAAKASKGQKHLYWPIDTHWTRVGAQAWVDGLAAHLDPALAERQRTRRGRETIETDVSFLGVIPETRETGPALFSSTPVRLKVTPAYDPDKQVNTYHSWRTKPAQRTWRGRTLLIGDSFTYRALDNVMALFAKGEFIWYGQPDIPSISDAIVDADTVVIEIVQRWVPISPLTQPGFIAEVRAALKGAKAAAPRS